VPVKELKALLCAPPHALTDCMVQLYVFALLKQGGWELVLNPATPALLSTGQPLPGNKLTANTVGLLDWNAKLDKSLLGARLVFSTQKGWDEVLPYARVLDASLKTAGPPDEQEERNTELLKLLANLNAELPQVESSLDQLAVGLSGTVPVELKGIIGQFKNIVAAADFREFDATVRVSFSDPAKFKTAFDEYGRARQVRERALELTQARAYLGAACNLDSALELNRTTLLGQLKLELLLAQPHVIGARLDAFNKWKGDYVQAYRKRHRAHYEELEKLNQTANGLRPRTIALQRLNSITELGPAVGGTGSVVAEFETFASLLWKCPDAPEAGVDGANATCPKCGWTPAKTLPQAEHDRLASAVTQGLDDRLVRLKDASIATVLKNAADGKKGAELKGLLEIIQLANADKLVGVMTDELAAFLRQLLQEANIVQESVTLAPILQQIGAIEEDRVDEAVSKFTSLLRNAIKDAKAKHGTGKRVRVFLRLDDGGSPPVA